MNKPTLIFDIEIYRDYFLVAFLNADTGNVRHLEMFDGQAFDAATAQAIVRKYRLVSFNGNGFDLPLLTLAIQGANCAKLKQVSDRSFSTTCDPGRWASSR
jgi:predicted PolB exonuclease-like 3'-5' exonuclease